MTKISLSYRLKILLVITGWGTSLATVTLGTIFQGFLLPTTGGGLLPEIYNANPLGLWIYYAGGFGISLIAAMVILDAGPAIVGFLSAFGMTALITSTVLALPDLVGIVQTPGVVEIAAVHFTFSALFPVALFVDMIGTLVGVALGERFLSLTGAFLASD